MAKVYYTFEVSAKQLKKMDIFGKSGLFLNTYINY
jgi:hypothetical protein